MSADEFPPLHSMWDLIAQRIADDDPRVFAAIIAVLVKRFGDMAPCENGCCIYPGVIVTGRELLEAGIHYKLLFDVTHNVLQLGTVDERHVDPETGSVDPKRAEPKQLPPGDDDITWIG